MLEMSFAKYMCTLHEKFTAALAEKYVLIRHFPPITCTRKYFILYSPSDISVLLDSADAELLLVSQSFTILLILLILLTLLCMCARVYCTCYSLPAAHASVCDYANTCVISCSYMIIKKES